MKIVCRTVTGASTTYEVEPSETVGDIKNRMSGEYDVASLRLCHKGKVLDDAKTIADLGFNDGEVLIAAGKKAVKSAPAPAAATPTPAPAPAPVQPAPAQSAPAPTVQPTPASAQPPAATPDAAPASDALPPGVDANSLEILASMGFPDRPSNIHALRCAYGNVDRAVEYLCTGIPAHVEAQFRQQAAQSTPQRAAPAPAPHSAPATSGPGANMTAEQLGAMMAEMQRSQGTPLERALAQIPQFEQIRALVRQNPSALPTVMQQLQQRHPDVFALVQQNPQEFLALINAPAGSHPSAGAGAADAQDEGDAGQVDLTPTPADAPAIERLVALGGGQWDARAAAIVYLVCRRNEELAANVLFDNGGLPPELVQAIQQGGMMGEDEEGEE